MASTELIQLLPLEAASRIRSNWTCEHHQLQCSCQILGRMGITSSQVTVGFNKDYLARCSATTYPENQAYQTHPTSLHSDLRQGTCRSWCWKCWVEHWLAAHSVAVLRTRLFRRESPELRRTVERTSCNCGSFAVFQGRSSRIWLSLFLLLLQR